MDAALSAALSLPVVHPFWAVDIELPGETVRLTDSVNVTLFGQLYLAKDPKFGVLSKVEGIQDGIEMTVPRPSIELMPALDQANADLGSPLAQGSRVRVFFGAWDRENGQSHGDPEQVFIGRLDDASLDISDTRKVITISCITGEASQLEPSAQRRASDAFHQAAWPGELGMSNIPFLSRKYYWRADEPRGGAAVTSTGGNPAIDVIDGVRNHIV